MYKHSKRQDLLDVLQGSICIEPEDWTDILYIIRNDKDLDFTTYQEDFIAEILTQEGIPPEFILSDLFTNQKGISQNVTFSFTDHALIRAVARGYTVEDVKNTIRDFISNSEEAFIRDISDDRQNKVTIKHGGMKVIIRPTKVIVDTPGRNRAVREFSDDIYYNEEEDKIVIGESVQFRIYTIIGKSPHTIGKPLKELDVGCFVPDPTQDVYTHSDLRDMGRYDWGSRWAKRIALRYVTMYTR